MRNAERRCCDMIHLSNQFAVSIVQLHTTADFELTSMLPPLDCAAVVVLVHA